MCVSVSVFFLFRLCVWSLERLSAKRESYSDWILRYAYVSAWTWQNVQEQMKARLASISSFDTIEPETEEAQPELQPQPKAHPKQKATGARNEAKVRRFEQCQDESS